MVAFGKTRCCWCSGWADDPSWGYFGHCRDALTHEASLHVAPHDLGQAVGSVITLRDITVRKARDLAISRRIEADDLT